MTQLAFRYRTPTSRPVVDLQKTFRTRPGDAGDRTTPRFARHERHVRAVLAQGGFPVLACGR